MMKLSSIFNLGVAIVLVVPAMTLQSGGARSLEESLKSTVAALERFAGVEQRLNANDATAIADVLASTEPPLADDRTRDARRDELRDALNRLQSELDAVDPAAAARATSAAPVAARASESREASTAAVESDRAASRTTAKSAFEPHGYVADGAKLAHGLYRQARYSEALVVLGDGAQEGEAAYWKARCLEQLGKTDEAIALYKRVIEKSSGRDLERAKEALEFLEWRLKFEQAAPAGAKKSG
jgi:tetratricopeptide (TPR) repeat protein